MKQVMVSDGAARLVRRLRTKEGMDEAKAAVCDALVLALQEAVDSGDMRLVSTGLSKSHLYKLTCTRQIPHYKPNGKYVYFDRGEIEDWMRQNRVNTQTEAEQQAIAHVVRSGRA